METLDTIFSNIIQNPLEPKYRSLRLENRRISKLLSNDGVPELLVVAGFVFKGTHIALSPSDDLARLCTAHSAILRCRSQGSNESPSQGFGNSGVGEFDENAAEKENRLRARVRAIFDEMTARGMSANEAAQAALRQAASEAMSGTEKSANNEVYRSEIDQLVCQPDPSTKVLEQASPDNSTRLVFEARVRQLFEEGIADGADATTSASRALEQAQAEMLASTSAVSNMDKDNERREERQPDVPNDENLLKKAPKNSRDSQDVEKETKFERMDDFEVVAEQEIDTINSLFKADGITFVDPSFPPTNRALYADERSSTTWECKNCRARNPIPPQPQTQELFQLLFDRSRPMPMISCAKCSAQHALLETAMRPTDWQRPTMIRDDVTMQYSTVPWEVFRDEPRADDVRQGIVGNCWLVCALSCLADESPSLLRSIVLTKEVNPAGAYQVRLCFAGQWITVLVDDILPTNALGCSAYLKPARRSLWGPLIEKACAKLHGSYEALNGGTFTEAFSTLTGYPAQKIPLRSRQPPPKPPSNDGDKDAIEAHAAMLETWHASQPDADVIYAQLLSYRASGFVVGASTFAFPGEEALASEMRNLGLQNPHAYCILQLGSLKDEPCVKLRNPNGRAGWNGRWSRNSSDWTYELRKEFLEGEDEGVFWMSWVDFFRFFAELTVCRILKDTMESREGGWLPSIFNAGAAVSLEVYARTNVHLSLHQEPHRSRGAGAMPTLVDLGMVVLKDEGNSHYTLVEHAERTLDSNVTLSASLEQDSHASRYVVLPLCFGHLDSSEPRRFRLATHSSQALATSVCPLSAGVLAKATIAIAIQHGGRKSLMKHPTLGECLAVYTLESSAGVALIAENPTPLPIRVELDAETSDGVVSTRGTLVMQDIVPPQSRLILVVLTIQPRAEKIAISYRFAAGLVDIRAEPDWATIAHVPDFSRLGELRQLHEPQSMNSDSAHGPSLGIHDASSVHDVGSLADSLWNRR